MKRKKQRGTGEFPPTLGGRLTRRLKRRDRREWSRIKSRSRKPTDLPEDCE